ncbi:MAG: DUF3108 domain-containing protein [Bacteroidaceae bacterium]|nr:DUF3108 domain-containing protein [Bacteroidaceae bacterium]
MKKYITTLLLCAAQFSTFRSALPLGSSKNFQLPLSAQCPVQNTAFQDGERLEYKLFFNWKFIWKTAGSATLTTRASTYQGRPAFQSDLITRTSGRIDRWFCMRDTLRSIVSTNIVPLYYHKASNEGGKNRFNRITYSYQGGKTLTHQYYRSPKGNITEVDHQAVGCAYDMLSMMLRARSYDPNQFAVGQRIPFQYVDNANLKTETLIYRGIREFTTEDQQPVTYRCLVFSYVEKNEKGKEKDVVTFYITDDLNHIPVRLDLFLRFGIAKAYLQKATGLRNPQTSIVKTKK